MSYISVDAFSNSPVGRFPTKKALKARIATDPVSVTFHATDAFGANAGKVWTADNLDTEVKYTVVGPNAYESRKWYATVERTEKGITVK